MQLDNLTSEQLRRVDVLIANKVKNLKTIADYIDQGDLPFVPHYTTNIAAAWELVEVLKAKGIGATLHIYEDYAICQLWRHDDPDRMVEAQLARTLPLAIVSAVLEAEGIDVGEVVRSE